MKSHSDNLLAIVGGICEDIHRAYPTLKGLSRDLERLSRYVSDRGLGVFTLDLPLLDAKLLLGLEHGLLDSKGTKLYSKRYPVPRLFAGLYMRIFDRNLRLREDADVNAVAMLRQILCLGKKTEVPCSRKRVAQAIQDYIDVERQLLPPTKSWDRDSLDHGGDNSIHLRDLVADDLPLFPSGSNRQDRAGDLLLLDRCQRVADIVAEWFGQYCPECFIEARRTGATGRLGLRHGPGAVAEKSGRAFNKYDFTNWSAKLQVLYPWETTGRMPNDPRVRPRNHEVPARLITVPKTAKGPRIIAAEPSEHMFCQNLFADWFIEKINTSPLGKFIDLKDQGKSGKMVLDASRTGELATIDLSSASDRLSLFVLERLFRRNPSLLNGIHSSRTRWIRLPNGEMIKLKKFASQGTALTFPVQTVCFLIFAIAATAKGDISKKAVLDRLVGKVRVYGDDIIIPTYGYADMVSLLTHAQLKVNMEKSFHLGMFRESCGVDAFKGYDVTPIKPKSTMSDNPASCQAFLDTTNNLFYKGYWNASIRLESRQPPRVRYAYGVVGRDAGATGYGSYSYDTTLKRWLYDRSYGETMEMLDRIVRSDCDQKWSRLDVLLSESARLHGLRGDRYRYNRRLQRIEVRTLAITSRVRVRPYDCGYSGLLDGQLRPHDFSIPQVSGLRGVPERPSYRKVRRWEALTALCGEG